MLESHFKEQVFIYTKDQHLVEALWQKVVKKYSGRSRFYHNLLHLESMLSSLQPVRDKIIDWTVIIFSIAFHDYIYKTYRKNNEEKSAEAAEKYLGLAGVFQNNIVKCRQQILATKNHEVSTDPDTNYFIDADLSVLGTDEFSYNIYCRNIRKEYKMFPDVIYNAGRKNFLAKLLEQDSIFKTEYFYQELENRARRNIAQEIGTL